MLTSDLTTLAPGETDCQGLAQMMGRIGDKWSIMVVGKLLKGRLRFNELVRQVPGVSHRMLALTLRNLERDGLIIRTAFGTVPPRVEYELSPLGRSLTQALSVLAVWAADHREEVENSQTVFDSALQQPKPDIASRATHGTVEAVPMQRRA